MNTGNIKIAKEGAPATGPPATKLKGVTMTNLSQRLCSRTWERLSALFTFFSNPQEKC